jgi:hypothetical protein
MGVAVARANNGYTPLSISKAVGIAWQAMNRGRQAKRRGAIVMGLSLSAQAQQTFNPEFATI